MRVSASIVIYHEDPQTLQHAVESFLALDCEKELIIVDNSPKPFSQNPYDSYPEIHYCFSGKNLGFGAGHNFAFSYLSKASDIHLIINPDTRFEGEAAVSFATWLLGQPEISLATPVLINSDGTLQHFVRPIPTLWMLIRRRIFKNEEPPVQNVKKIEPIPFAHGSFLGLRSAIFKKLGGFDERFFLYMEDVDLFLRAKALGKTVIYPHFTVTHEHRRGSAKSLKLLLIHIVSAIKFFWKYR